MYLINSLITHLVKGREKEKVQMKTQLICFYLIFAKYPEEFHG